MSDLLRETMEDLMPVTMPDKLTLEGHPAPTL